MFPTERILDITEYFVSQWKVNHWEMFLIKSIVYYNVD